MPAYLHCNYKSHTLLMGNSLYSETIRINICMAAFPLLCFHP